MSPIKLPTTSHGETISALVQSPATEALGSIILLQEIFGLDQNMQADAERWAAAGYHVIMPSLFDRVTPGFLAKHDEEGFKAGFAAVHATPDTQALDDIRACIDWAKAKVGGRIFVVGYCYGGRLAWLAANACAGVAAAIVYYGDVLRHIDMAPQCPVICHFGAKDPHLPGDKFVAGLKERHPAVVAHNYAGSGHGFNNSGTPDADPLDAELARKRSKAFLSALT
jgi:carboxymethylenebutenolidase